jgi:hypothetical protein
VYLEQYSLFIDGGEARYNLSADLMCRSDKPDDQAYVTLRFMEQDGFYSRDLSASISETLFVDSSNTFCLFQNHQKEKRSFTTSGSKVKYRQRLVTFTCLLERTWPRPLQSEIDQMNVTSIVFNFTFANN